jgi:hypothetical protein
MSAGYPVTVWQFVFVVIMSLGGFQGPPFVAVVIEGEIKIRNLRFFRLAAVLKCRMKFSVAISPPIAVR